MLSEPLPPARDGQATWERPSACAGELLLETQLKAWTSEFAYLPVRPVPGTMWIFPGYMPHAVLPRATSADGALRISVACNVAVRAEAERAEHLERDLVRPWWSLVAGCVASSAKP